MGLFGKLFEKKECSVCGGENRRALGAGNVGAGVGADLAGDGVYTMSEL